MAAYDNPDDTADEVLEAVNPMLLRVTPLPLPLGTLLSCSAGDCEPSGDGRGPCANVLPRVELAPSLSELKPAAADGVATSGTKARVSSITACTKSI